MAVIVFGPLITGARGTIAGTILTANKAGPYARGWSRGPNQRSPAQTLQRRVTAAMAQAWRSLTQVQRDAWDTWAALPAQEKFNSLGQSYFASGFNWYVCINDRLTNVGRAVRTAPPVIARPAAPPIGLYQFRQTPSVGQSYISYPAATFAGVDLILFVAVSNSIGVLNKTHGWRLLLQIQGAHATIEYFQPELEAAFGTVLVGQRGFGRCARQTTDGVRSAFDTGYNDFVV